MRTVAILLVSLLFLPLVHSTPPAASSHSEPTSDDYDPDDHYVVIRYPIIWDIKDINISAVVDAAAKQTEEEVYRAAGLPPPANPFPYPRLIDPETAEYKPLPILPDDWVSVSVSQLDRLQELRAQQPQPPTDPLLLQQLQDLERRLVSRVKFIEQLPKPLKENIAADLEKLLPLLPDDWLKPTAEQKQKVEQQKEDLFKRTDLSDPQLHLALMELQKPLQQRVQHLQQLQRPLNQAPQVELDDLAALLTDNWLKLNAVQQQRLHQLHGQSQPLTDPQEREELRVLQHRAAQRILHLQHLQQLQQLNKPELQQELAALLPLMPGDWLKLTPEQIKRLAELQQQQPLPEPALKEELWQLQQGLLLRKQYLEDLQKLQPQNLKLQKELDKQKPLLADDSHKLAPSQLERLKQLHQAQPLTDPQEQEELRVLQQHAELRVLQLQQRQHSKSELQQELDDLLPVLPEDWLQLSPLQLQRLKDLVQLHQQQALTDPQEQEELRVLQQRADLRVQQLEHLQQLLQPGTTLQPELQQELDDLQPLLPQLPGKRQAARQSAQEPTAVASATKQLVRARRHLG